MVAEPPPSPRRTSHKPDLVELRIANLWREFEAETDPPSQAAVLYEIGVLREHTLGQTEKAADVYARAAAADPLFQPPLLARLRIAERAPVGTLRQALCDAMAMAAPSGPMRSAALVDLALVTDQWADLLREAIASAPEATSPGLILEWRADEHRDPQALSDALRAQAEASTNPALCAALWLDVALAELDLGEIDSSLEAIEHVCAYDDLRWQGLWLAVRVTRAHRRWDAFDRASQGLAALVEAAIDLDEPVDPLRLPVPADRRADAAALLWAEAAIRRYAHLGDAEGATTLLARALRLRPDDSNLRLHALTLAHAAGAAERIAEAEAWFAEHEPRHPGYLASSIRRALAHADAQESLAEVASLHAATPDSMYARAALEVAQIRAQAVEPRVASLRERDPDLPDAFHRTWHAAQLAADLGDRFAAADSIYDEAAASAAGGSMTVLREAMGQAWVHGAFDRFCARCDQLLDADLDADERALIGFSKYDVLQHVLEDSEAARTFLHETVDDPAHQAWAPPIARARAALSGDLDLLIRAHEQLAIGTVGEIRVGHLCAAAHGHAREERWSECEDTLRRALDESPEDPYALSLLEGVMRESGRPEDAVSLTEKRSLSDPAARLDGLSLLLAGASAERDGNLSAARHAYEVALRASPASTSAALSLLDIARKQGDREAMIRAYAALAGGDLPESVAAQFAMLHADALASAERHAEAAEAYETALAEPSTRVMAAVSLLSVPGRATTDVQRAAAERALSAANGSAATSDETPFAAAYVDWRESLERGRASGEPWLGFSALSSTPEVKAATLLQGLRATAVARGAEAGDELFMAAQGAADLAHTQPRAAAAIDESVGPGDDAEFRVASLSERVRHANELALRSLLPAYWRALVDAGRGPEAVAALTAALDERPDDLALWEILRSVARQAEDWSLVALCCDRLAQYVQGPLRGDLLEEAALVRLDQLAQQPQAEDLLRAALEADPTREIAFRRLHDLLTAREDADALQALVAARLERGGADGREDLLYERARLLRGFSDRAEALEVLDELFATSPGHPGALALAAEIHVSLEHWEDAVDNLMRLALTDIPREQKRVAHLGAADFLERHLDRHEDALAQLRAVDELGLANASTLTRVAALERRRGDEHAAADACERALALDPTHREAMAALVELVDASRLGRMLARFEDAIWSQIERGRLDEARLGLLQDAAAWGGQTERASVIEGTLDALRTGSTQASGAVERTRLDGIDASMLPGPPPDGAVVRLMRQVGPALDKVRTRSRRKVPPGSAVHGQLDQLSRRAGSAIGQIADAAPGDVLVAKLNRHDELDWLVPEGQRDALSGAALFDAGRLAWITARGARPWLDVSLEKAAGQLAGILRAGRREPTADIGGIPRIEIKLPRAGRRSVVNLLPEDAKAMTAVLDDVRWFQSGADQAGLLACGNIGTAMSAVLGREALCIENVRKSERALGLLRFWLHHESVLWGPHG